MSNIYESFRKLSSQSEDNKQDKGLIFSSVFMYATFSSLEFKNVQAKNSLRMGSKLMPFIIFKSNSPYPVAFNRKINKFISLYLKIDKSFTTELKAK
ncbi:hypothetical protein V1477_017873 [Vespula maculifrons]|uniref:Uncharacterized protein n=1 Tax=Vespula maculifrons TaxID=7453 RepID=A0ABD2AZL0_VESMC